MKKTMTVLICDDDRFYAAGLKSFLQGWFATHRIGVHFSSDFQQRARADLLFIARRELSPYRIYVLRQEVKITSRAIFIINQQQDDPAGIRPGITPLASIELYREAPLATLEEKLEEVLHQVESTPAPSRNIASHISLLYQLTFRETQILRYLARGISHAMVAHYLHISEKTVSAHKRNIMAKLNLSRTTELNYWLIKEGFFARQKTPHTRISKH